MNSIFLWPDGSDAAAERIASRVLPRREQFIERRERRTPRHFGRARTMRGQGIDNTDKRHAGKTGQHAAVIAAHHASANHADAKRPIRSCRQSGCRFV